jgi:hypothetical protein
MKAHQKYVQGNVDNQDSYKPKEQNWNIFRGHEIVAYFRKITADFGRKSR